jgi:hypothetical protein
MQNAYAVERFIQEHNAHARAVAELQALQRQAVAARRRKVWETWRMRLIHVLARPAGTRRERVSARLVKEGR